MSTLKLLIREAHRRSIWQVLAIDLAGSFGALPAASIRRSSSTKRYIDERMALLDRWYPGPVLEGVAQLHDQRGDAQRAARFYARFVELWQGRRPPSCSRGSVRPARGSSS